MINVDESFDSYVAAPYLLKINIIIIIIIIIKIYIYIYNDV